MALVSIIMNVRNGAATLREAIDSVLQQTCRDWELIVWDDLSSDDSAKIVAQYRDQRIRYILSPEEVSLGRARSRAIRCATAEWIAFLDQDDVWLANKLERQLALAEEGVGLIYGRTVRFYPSGLERDYDQAHEYQLLPEGDIFSKLFTKSCFVAMSSALFRRSAIAATGGIPDKINIIPDYWLYVAVTSQYRARAVQTVVCRYRMHADNLSQVSALQMHQEALWLVDQWSDRLEQPTVALCHRRHATAIALEEMRSLGTRTQGMKRLLIQGSLSSQLMRPFAFVFHLVRRHVWPPYWRKLPARAGS